MRVIPAPVAAEQSFRVLIDKLPQPDTALTNGVTIRLRYSVPVFVEPAGAACHLVLSWHLARGEHGRVMRVDNAGTRRAQIAAVQLVNAAGKVYEINKGLLGYALRYCRLFARSANGIVGYAFHHGSPGYAQHTAGHP
ncbi:hypothetical protein B0G76_8639 [Paraburkholderia sp. BL23I1N1]|nr:hypothetical protein B0G76_8639 [Paraburkholderia sp. BL23I1N1]